MGVADTQKSGVLWQQGRVYAVAAAFKAAMGEADTQKTAYMATAMRSRRSGGLQGRHGRCVYAENGVYGNSDAFTP